MGGLGVLLSEGEEFLAEFGLFLAKLGDRFEKMVVDGVFGVNGTFDAGEPPLQVVEVTSDKDLTDPFDVLRWFQRGGVHSRRVCES